MLSIHADGSIQMWKGPAVKFVLFIISFFLITPLYAETVPSVAIKILHVNDTHGHVLPVVQKSLEPQKAIGGAARLAQMIEEERRKNPDGTLLLSGGDMFQGTAVSNIFRGEPVLDFMNAVRFDAMAIGNHEFDWGRDTLDKLRESARFPFLSANIRGRAGNLAWESTPYVILERKGLKIAVIGVTATETRYTTKPGNVEGLEFRHPRMVLPGVLKEVRSQGAKTIILLSHAGFDADKALATEVSDIDVIVGGHSHTAVHDPVALGRTIIVQAGCCAQYLGVLNLSVDSQSGRVIRYTREKALKKVYSGPDDAVDPRITEIISVYRDRIKDRVSTCIAETTVDLARNARGESKLGNLICDAMKEAEKADIAFQNNGGIRANIPAGKITPERVYAVLPFDDALISMDLTGKQILHILELNARDETFLLQVSGLKIEYDMIRPKGKRVLSAEANGTPLRPNRTYRVVTNDFLAAGGNRLFVFQQGKNLRYGDQQRESFIRYLERHGSVHPRIEGRIVIRP